VGLAPSSPRVRLRVPISGANRAASLAAGLSALVPGLSESVRKERPTASGQIDTSSEGCFYCGLKGVAPCL